MSDRRGASAYRWRRRRTAPGEQLAMAEAEVRRCPRCRGTGERDGAPCGTCGATAVVTRVTAYAAAEERNA